MLYRYGKNLIIGLVWVVSYFILYLYQVSCSYDSHLSSHLVVAFIDQLCLFSCFLYIIRYLVPGYLYKKKMRSFSLLFLVLIVISSNVMQGLTWLWYTLSGNLNSQTLALTRTPFYQLFTAYLLILFGCICIIAFKLTQDQLVAEARYTQLQKENAQTELSFLKAQINPHFLFNSINSIFAHIDRRNTVAREIVLKFSDMLRYQLYECNVELIDFDKEIAYLNNYIELQKLRKEDNLNIDLHLTGNMAGFKIAPLLVTPFIENAFKFVSSNYERESFIKISIERQPQEFIFRCINTKDRIASNSLVKNGGIGINNVKRRLELLYPGNYTLSITDHENIFEVQLKILMK